MPIYRVFVSVSGTKLLGEYEAMSEEQAIKQAENEEDSNVTLCWHCSQNIDVEAGEFQAVIVEGAI